MGDNILGYTVGSISVNEVDLIKDQEHLMVKMKREGASAPK